MIINILIVKSDASSIATQAYVTTKLVLRDGEHALDVDATRRAAWGAAVTEVLRMADDSWYSRPDSQFVTVFMREAGADAPAMEQHTVESLRADRAAGRI